MHFGKVQKMKGVEKYMRKVTKYGRRMRMLFAVAATMAGIGVMMLIPWDKGFAKAEDTFYSVIVNDYEVGNVVSKEEAEAIYAKTCDKLEAENDQSVYVDASLVVVENDAVMGKATDSAQLEQNMYHELKNSLVPAQETAYSVTIEDTSVVLSSLEEVTEVVNTVADQYDTENRYQAVIEEENDARFGEATCELVQASIEPVNKPMVMAAESTDTAAVNTQESLSLGSQIEIVQTYADKKEVLSVEEAV